MEIFEISLWCTLHKKFRNIVTMIIILSALQPVDLSQVTPGQHCAPVSEADLQIYCKANYPEESVIKYRDHYVAKGDEYAIYTINNDKKKFFVSFRLSKLSLCQKFKYLSKTHFICLDDESDIYLKNGSVFCFNINIQYVDDLLRNCGKYGKSNFVALHYPYFQLRNGNGDCQKWSVPKKWWSMTVANVIFTLFWKYIYFA